MRRIMWTHNSIILGSVISGLDKRLYAVIIHGFLDSWPQSMTEMCMIRINFFFFRRSRALSAMHSV